MNYEKKKEYHRLYCRKWYAKNKERVKKQRKRLREKNKEKIKERNKKWREENREYFKLVWRRYNLNPKFRLDHNIRWLIWDALKRKKEGLNWEKLVGYTLQDLVKHLENQFDSQMSWDNYGSYWWIDHIIPRSHFKYEIPEDPQFKQCWALKNLQPMEKIANIKKGNRI